jgi:hypothetical protein
MHCAALELASVNWWLQLPARSSPPAENALQENPCWISLCMGYYGSFGSGIGYAWYQTALNISLPCHRDFRINDAASAAMCL